MEDKGVATVEVYEPKNLKLWTMPSNYAGEVWPGWFVFLGQHRDSDILTQSNFDSALKRLGGETEGVRVIRERHWAVGWVEWIGIEQDEFAALKIADEIAAELKDYPIIDEDDYSNREFEAVLDFWDGWSSKPDLQHRIQVIADWNKRHEHWGAEFKPVPVVAARHSLQRLSELYPCFEQWIEEIGRE